MNKQQLNINNYHNKLSLSTISNDYSTTRLLYKIVDDECLMLNDENDNGFKLDNSKFKMSW